MMTTEERIDLEILYRRFMGADTTDLAAIRAECTAEQARLSRMVLERAGWPSADRERGLFDDC